ncbi:hypothetical protein BTVI_78915 [Pitangus sulphuratus]|nr:hypothetical protein BTVI_78915 [Pitangus sulphuratus]
MNSKCDLWRRHTEQPNPKMALVSLAVLYTVERIHNCLLCPDLGAHHQITSHLYSYHIHAHLTQKIKTHSEQKKKLLKRIGLCNSRVCLNVVLQNEEENERKGMKVPSSVFPIMEPKTVQMEIFFYYFLKEKEGAHSWDLTLYAKLMP